MLVIKTVTFTSAEIQAMGVVGGVLLMLVVVGSVLMIELRRDLGLLAGENADLRLRLKTAERVGETQELALRTVGEIAQATRRRRS